ncbi:MAG: hypothetical protein ACYSUI_24765, partial [Planctomycetota bacterium]
RGGSLMASLDVMGRWGPLSNQAPIWTYVAFTSGSVEPSKGDTIWGRGNGANAVLEYIELTSGTWVGTDAAGFMLLSNHNGTAWLTGDTFAANDSAPSTRLRCSRACCPRTTTAAD